MASSSKLFQLSGTCNSYDWGQKGRNSLAARLCEKTPGTGFTIKDDDYYSEMWFGDYPDFPARDLKSGATLGELIENDPERLLGSESIKQFGKNLPFLPKILSIASALPLQIHPNKELAAELHQEYPDRFSDANHKPEIAVALSKFEVFVGWKPLKDITHLFYNIASLQGFIPSAVTTSQWDSETLKSLVKNILTADEATVKTVEDNLLSWLESQNNQKYSYMQDLLPRIQRQFSPTDPGALVALLCMNFLVLQPGDSIFVPEDGIHAYLSGDIVECMARSNNMLTGGLCPVSDRTDIDLFTRTLTFREETQAGQVRLPATTSRDPSQKHTRIYSPPLSEFDIIRVDLIAGGQEPMSSHKGPMVAIVISGEGTISGDEKELEAKEGFIFYVGPDTSTTLQASSDMQVFAAVARAV